MSSSNYNFGYGTRDSFVKLLLRVQPLQTALVTALTQRMVDYASAADTNSSAGFGSDSNRDGEDDFLCLTGSNSSSSSFNNGGNQGGGSRRKMAVALNILNHIRWCEVHYNPRAVLTLLLDTVEVLPKSLQIDVISALPAVASDRDHPGMVERLLEIMESQTGEYQQLL
jgi:hypothetical protein